jgi:hypothetical protein
MYIIICVKHSFQFYPILFERSHISNIYCQYDIYFTRIGKLIFLTVSKYDFLLIFLCLFLGYYEIVYYNTQFLYFHALYKSITQQILLEYMEYQFDISLINFRDYSCLEYILICRKRIPNFVCDFLSSVSLHLFSATHPFLSTFVKL